MTTAYGSSTFGHITQLAYVTNDFDRALSVFRERHNVPKFLEMRDIDLPTRGDVTAHLHFGFAIVDDIQIELIQPLGGADETYRSGLTGQAFQIKFHHVCQQLSSLRQLEEVRAEAGRTGRVISLWGSYQGVATYLYLDERSSVGHFLEYIYYDPEFWRNMLANIPKFGSGRN